jgi:rod shape-determining protein MreC
MKWTKAQTPSFTYHWKQWAVIFAVWVTLALAEFLGLATPIKTLVLRLLQPVQVVAVTQVLNLKMLIWEVKAAWTAEEALVLLQKDHAQALSRLSALEAVEAENLELRKLLQNSDRKLTKTILAVPISAFAQPAIAAGSSDGITAGMAVLTQGQLLGFVTQVQPTQSVVTLLTQPQAKPIVAKTESGVAGLVQGDGHQLLLTQVSADSSVKVGEKVTTVGQVGVQPRLFIGTVARVEAQPAAAVQTIWLQQPLSFFAVAVVEVQ